MFVSMTGYGRAEAENTQQKLVIEIKSLNGRHLDLSLNAPPAFQKFEFRIREKLREVVKRGRVFIFIQFEPREEFRAESLINFDLLNLYSKALMEFADERGYEKTLRAGDLFQLLPYVQHPEPADFEDEELLIEVLDKALEQLGQSRREEGMRLTEEVKRLTEELEKLTEEIARLCEGREERIRDRLLSRFHQLKLEQEIDEGRFLHEVVYHLERMDIQEEIVRIQSHLEELRNLIDSEKSEGRRLGFILQELNREANTINAKAGESEIVKRGCRFKELVEQLREQAHNLE